MALTTIQSASFDQFVREVKNIDFDVSSLSIGSNYDVDLLSVLQINELPRILELVKN